MSAQTVGARAGETPLWTPSADRIKNSRIEAFRREAERKSDKALPDYAALWQWSVDASEDFWSLVWDFCGVIGDKGPVVLENAGKMPGGRYFPQGRINFAENLLRRRDDATAIVFRGEDKVERRLSFRALYDRVSQLRQVLQENGVGEDDRVAGYVANMPEAIVGLLATASLGAIWSSASPDFGVQGVVDRFGQIAPKVMIAVDAYHYNGKIVDCLGKLRDIQPQIEGLKKTLIIPYVSPNPDLSQLSNAENFETALAKHKPADIAFTRYAFNRPLLIMYSSGTTGVPKCIVHGAGGTLIQHLKEHQLQCDVKRDDKVFYFTTCGWMMWNWQVSALASEATLLLYDGSPFYPDADAMFNYADAEGMTLFGTSAKYIDALHKQDRRPKDTNKLTSVRTMTSTGSPLVHESYDYVYDAIKSDLHLASISGGTDIVSCFVLGNVLSPVWRGEIQGPGLGMAVDVYDESGHPSAVGTPGELVCTRPFPAMPTAFWNDPDGAKYRAAYFETFPGVWRHGDWVTRTPHGGFVISGRSDATLNPGGVRIGTAEIYRQVEVIPEVVESLVVGHRLPGAVDGDQRVILFVHLRDGVLLDQPLEELIRQRIRSGASPHHVPKFIIQVADLPRTRNGKLSELAVRDTLEGREVKNLGALANPEALAQFRDRAELRA